MLPVVAVFVAIALAAASAGTTTLCDSAITLTWTVDRHLIHFNASINDRKWLAIGFNDQVGMAGVHGIATAIIFKPSERSIGQYAILGDQPDSFVPHPSPLTTNFSFFDNGVSVSMSFTRGFWNGNAQDVQIAQSGTTIVTCAVGDTLMFNSSDAPDNMDSTTIQFPEWRYTNQGCGGTTFVYWVVSDPDIHFLALVNDVKWLAVGFNDRSGMSGDHVTATAIIAKPVDRTVQQYAIYGISGDFLVPHSTSGTRNLFYSQANFTSLSFTRGFNNGNSSDLIIQPGQPIYLTCAVGNTNQFNIGDVPNNMDATQVTIGTQTNATLCGISLSWKVEDSLIHFTATLNVLRWFGIGFNDHRGMRGLSGTATAIILKPAERILGQFEIWGGGENKFVYHNTTGCSNFSFTSNAEGYSVSFTRGFFNGDRNDVQINGFGTTFVTCAVGNTINFSTTDTPNVMEAVEVNFNNSAPVPPPPTPPPPTPPPPPPPPPPPGAITLCSEITLNWVVDYPFIHFNASLNDSKWFAVGFNDQDGEMVGQNGTHTAVIVKPGDRTIGQYSINDYTRDSILPHPTSDTFGFSYTLGNNYTLMSFTRGLSTGDYKDVNISALGITYVTCAVGNVRDFTGDAPNLMDDEPVRFNITIPPPSPPSPPPPPPSPSYDFTVQLDPRLALSWSVDGAVVSFQLVLQQTGWAAIGISSDGNMVGSDAFVAIPGANAIVQEYYLGGTDPSDEQPILPSILTNVSISAQGGVVVARFTRLLDSSTSHRKSISATSYTPIIWAYSNLQTFTKKHTNQGSVKINFATGQSENIVDTIKVVHGSLMTLAMGILLPCGVLVARFAKTVEPTTGPRAFWFLYHQVLQYSGVVVMLVGFAIAIYFTSDNSVAHFSCLHSVFGLIVVILACIQPINAFIRPAKTASLRPAWELWHKASGRLVLVGSVATIFLGLRRIDAADYFVYLYAFFPAAFVAVFVVLEYRKKVQNGYTLMDPDPLNTQRTEERTY